MKVEDTIGVPDASLVLDAITHLPENLYVRIGVEALGLKKPIEYVCATLFERVPDGGWPDITNAESKYADKPITGISAAPGDPRFWTLLFLMLKERRQP